MRRLVDRRELADDDVEDDDDVDEDDTEFNDVALPWLPPLSSLPNASRLDVFFAFFRDFRAFSRFSSSLVE